MIYTYKILTHLCPLRNIILIKAETQSLDWTKRASGSVT
jgi:hypothetical protein